MKLVFASLEKRRLLKWLKFGMVKASGMDRSHVQIMESKLYFSKMNPKGALADPNH